MTTKLNPDALFDSAERNAALDVTKSFIVQAPAGSGKTELLIQRILSLLCHVQKPEEILAITFTKKAANEMRLRVINALKLASQTKPQSSHTEKTWQLANKVIERDKKYSWGILQNSNQLNIQTIDSLCSYLTKQLPLLSQFGAPPNILIQPNIIYEKAINEVLSHLNEDYPWKRSLQYLLLHLDNNIPKLTSLLTTLLAKRDQWIPFLKYTKKSSDAKIHLEKYIELFIKEKLSNLGNIFPKVALQELTTIASHCASNLKLSQKSASFDVFYNDNVPPKPLLNDLNKWVALATLMLTKDRNFRKRATNDNGFISISSIKNKDEKALHERINKHYISILESLNENDLLKKSLHDLLSIPPPHYSNEEWDTLYSLLDILKVLLAQLRVVFQAHGKIDFIENTQAALLALGDEEHPTNLTLALDYQFKHILIDEFQDTSITQFQLLEKLMSGWELHDERSIFIVGDPMQSIYRFRDAEVGLFIKTWKNGIKNKTLGKLNLSVNFRSTNTIVEWNNLHFSQLFPSVDLVSEGAVSFSSSMAPFHKNNLPDTYTKIVACDHTDANLQAASIANEIQQLKMNYPNDTIAILVRSRSHIKAIIPALKKHQLSFQASEIDNLYSKQPIKDLLSLTNALLDLSNKVAWLAILRAPWCGLSLADLVILSPDEKADILWYRLNDKTIIEQFSDHGKEQARKIIQILKVKLSERDRKPLLELIESTWMLLGGPACLDIDTTYDDIDFFFSIVDTVQHDLSPYTMHQFETTIKHSFSSKAESDSNVTIMTIHAAKGLEFDTVIIPHLERSLPNNDKELLAWLEYPLNNHDMALLLAPLQPNSNNSSLLHDFIHKQQKIKLDYEVDRLLYVATTRAKKRLFLSFAIKYNDAGEEVFQNGSFLQKLWPYIKNEYSRENLAPLEFNNPDVYQKKLLCRLSNAWQNPLHFDAKITSLHNQKLGFSLKNETPRLIGNAIHAILQIISKKSLSWWLQLHQDEKDRFILSQERLFNIPSKNQPIAHSKIIHDLNKITNDPIGQWILSPHSVAASEYAISIADDDNSNFIIDRTFIDKNNVRWIIDYKTMDVTIDSISKHIDTYKKQLESYYHAFKLKENRIIKLGIYFTALPTFQEISIS